MFDLGIDWCDEEVGWFKDGTGFLVTRQEVVHPKGPPESWWKPLGPIRDRMVTLSGRVFVTRTTAAGVTQRRGFIEVRQFEGPVAHVSVNYAVTVSTGAIEDMVGGTKYAKANILCVMPCYPNEMDAMREDLQDYVGKIVQEEESDILKTYGLGVDGGAAKAQGT